MKTKIMALILAVGLGVTGVAVRAHAADGKCTCANPNTTTSVQYEGASYWNGEYHMVYNKIITTCLNCGYEDAIQAGYLEPHDYEQTYFSDGKVESYCATCGDRYYW